MTSNCSVALRGGTLGSLRTRWASGMKASVQQQNIKFNVAGEHADTCMWPGAQCKVITVYPYVDKLTLLIGD